MSEDIQLFSNCITKVTSIKLVSNICVRHRELNGLCAAYRKPEAQRVDWNGLLWHYVPSQHLSTDGGLDWTTLAQCTV
jgi:hypothetical protein